jgi:hypothetical protein
LLVAKMSGRAPLPKAPNDWHLADSASLSSLMNGIGTGADRSD